MLVFRLCPEVMRSYHVRRLDALSQTSDGGSIILTEYERADSHSAELSYLYGGSYTFSQTSGMGSYWCRHHRLPNSNVLDI